MTDISIHELVHRLRLGLGDRRHTLAKAIGIGAGAAGIATTVKAQDEFAANPTPGPEPTSTPGQLVIEPSPTMGQLTTEPSPTTEPTPTMGSFTSQPTLEPTSEPVPEEPTATAVPDDGDMTGQEDCPPMAAEIKWFCWPSPLDVWYPIFPPDDVADETGVAWYGVRLDRENGVLAGTAYTRGGQELSRCELGSDGEVYQLSLSDAQAELNGSFTVEFAPDRTARIGGDLHGQPIDFSLSVDQPERDALPVPALEQGHTLLLRQWSPAFYELADLLEIAAPEGGPLEGPGACAVLGFLAGANCLVWLGVPPVGYEVCYDRIERASEVC